MPTIHAVEWHEPPWLPISIPIVGDRTPTMADPSQQNRTDGPLESPNFFGAQR
jgi:hypothetical protein